MCCPAGINNNRKAAKYGRRPRKSLRGLNGGPRGRAADHAVSPGKFVAGRCIYKPRRFFGYERTLTDIMYTRMHVYILYIHIVHISTGASGAVVICARYCCSQAAQLSPEDRIFIGSAACTWRSTLSSPSTARRVVAALPRIVYDVVRSNVHTRTALGPRSVDDSEPCATIFLYANRRPISARRFSF